MNHNKVPDTLYQNIVDIQTLALLQLGVHTSFECPPNNILVILTHEQNKGSVVSLLPQLLTELNPIQPIHRVVADDAVEGLMAYEFKYLLSEVSGLEDEGLVNSPKSHLG